MTGAEADNGLRAKREELVGRLMLLEDDGTLDVNQRALAAAWHERLELARTRAEAELRVAFIAEVGKGKSTLIAAAADLRVDDTRKGPKQWSVLPIGDGLTTLGETQLHFEERDDIAIEVVPIARSQLLLELRLFAEDQWAAIHAPKRRGASVSADVAGEEFHRLLRKWLAPDAENPRKEIRALATSCESANELLHLLRGRLDLDLRTQAWSRHFTHDLTGLTELRAVLDALMSGKLVDAPAPAIIHLRVPRGPLGELTTLVDTRGVDPEGAELSIKGRTDLLRYLDDPDTLLVVCTEYEPGLGAVAAKLLEALHERNELRSRSRTWRLVIVDKRGIAEGVDDPEGMERREVCLDKLGRAGIEDPEGAVQLIDVQTSRGVGSLRAMLQGLVNEERARRRQSWTELHDQAEAAIEHLRDHEFAALAREHELRLWWVWDAAATSTAPEVRDGLGICSAAIRSKRLDHWSHLHAACRRRGRYAKFDLAVVGANWAAALHTREYLAGHAALMHYLETKSESLDPRLRSHLESHQARITEVLVSYLKDLTELWKRALVERFESPEFDDLWSRCQARWGQGEGYVDDIAEYFAEEANRAEVVLDPATLPLPIEARLDRPALLELSRISLRNFRGIEAATLDIGPGTTVLIGDNGAGKTSWLEAVTKTIGVLLPGLGAEHAPKLTRDDIRQVVADEGGGQFGSHFQTPMELTLNATLQGRELEWGRAIDRAPLPEPGSEVVERENPEGAVQRKAGEIAADIGEEVRSHAERQLPVLAYYGTQRLWPAHLTIDDRREVGSRLDGYRDCLDAASTHGLLLKWMRKQTMIEIQRKQPVTQLRAIERAVVACVPGSKEFRYQLDIEDLMLVMHSGEHRRFQLLSDGYRNMVAMVADIAWRASRLNPQLGAAASAYVEGVVLIDELDLHLHPKWQRHVLADIRRTFPRLQFIITTHNPMILASARRERIVRLKLDETGVLHLEQLDRDPRLATGTELYADFFGVTDLYPSELGAALDRYGQLAVNPFRTDAEDKELHQLLAKLEAEEIVTHLQPVAREVEA